MARVRPARHRRANGGSVGIELDPGFSVGVEEIDAEHRQIVRRARRLETALNGGTPEEIRGALKFLHACLAERFENEERWMAEAGYPGSGEHARIHSAILDAVTAARQEATRARDPRTGAAAAIAATLERHMRNDDLKLGRFHTARENLRLLAEAGPGVGAALTPIPGMLAVIRPAPVPGAERGAPPPGISEGDDE